MRSATGRLGPVLLAAVLAGCEEAPEYASRTRQVIETVSGEGTEEPSPTPAVENRARSELVTLARRAARREEIDPALLTALIEVESSWNPEAVSPKGARGLTQLMPETARREFGLEDPDKLFDPETNLRLGTAHLRELFERFCTPRLTLWAWHAGTRRVDPWADRITPASSRRFVRRVLAGYPRTEPESVRPAHVRYPPQQCSEPVPVAGRSGEPEAVRAGEGFRAPRPVVESAWISRLTARVGEPVNLRIEASNRGGSARRGEIIVTLQKHPRLRVGYRSDLPAAFHGSDQGYRTLGGAISGDHAPRIQATSEDWEEGERHWLFLRLEELLESRPGQARGEIEGALDFIDEATSRVPLRDVHELRYREKEGRVWLTLGIPTATFREIVDAKLEVMERSLESGAVNLEARRQR